LPIVVLFASATRATASCGDYVHILPAGQTAPEGEHPPTDQPCPCRGPSCGKTPVTPAAPSPAPVQTLTQTADALLTPSDEDNSTRSTTLTDTADRTPGGAADPIFHPPR
jgi:hypothetical protein